MSNQANKQRPRIIFFAPILEYPPAGGPQMSVTNAIKALNQIVDLHIVTTVPECRLDQIAIDFFEQNSCGLQFAPSSKLHSDNQLFDRILRRIKRVEVAPLLAHFDVKFIKKYASEHEIEIFWVDRVLEHAFALFTLLRRQLPDAKIVGDTEAVYSRFVLREIPYIKNVVRKAWVKYQGKKKEREEIELSETADVVTAVSELDANYFRSIAPKSGSIKLFSNIVDLDDFSGDCENVGDGRPYVLLIGSFGNINSPMDRAAKWLVEDIMPLVVREVPDAHAYIVGRNADLTLSHYNGDSITIKGRVPSMRPYLKNALASLVPLHYESGTRFKILETGAASVPCISTTLGAEGIEVTNGKDIIIADTTETFAAAIVSLFKDTALADSFANNLHALISEKYSLDVQKQDGEAIIAYLQCE